MYRVFLTDFLLSLLSHLVSCQGNRNWDFNRIIKTIGVEEGMILGEAGAGGQHLHHQF